MRYEQLESLEKFLARVEQRLLSDDNRLTVLFPQAAKSPWDGNALVQANQEILKAISGAANLYAIFTASSESEVHTLRYIGKSTKKLARQRITNHLFRKDERTGSKLAEVADHVVGGGSVQIAWVGIHTESLRNYLEEELILRHPEADWNRENKGKRATEAKTLRLRSEA